MQYDEQPQVLIEWAHWPQAEQGGQTLLSTLNQRGAFAGLTRWWFLRKHPHWRLRYTGTRQARVFLEALLEDLHRSGHITTWTHTLYEPETTAFGGASGLEQAHHLFHQDSRHLLAYLELVSADHQVLGRRESGLLLGSALLRGAGLDPFEQADAWARLNALRPLPKTFCPDAVLRSQVRTLVTTDPRSFSPESPGHPWKEWSQVFTETGRRLADLAQRGRLSRGLRAVLAHLLLFSFNRWGLSYRDQHMLTTTAHEVLMTDHTPTTTSPTRVEELHTRLVDQLHKDGSIRSPRVKEAFHAVPRHAFLPHATAEEAYTNAPVHIKYDETGASISCGSQPGVVAMMLEQAAIEPGMRVLELGAGTGYNAALLGHLVGPSGSVTTIDVDDDLVQGAQTRLKEQGSANVEAVLGDGALGHPDKAPFDRIIATVGSHDVPRAWVEQLAPGGRLIVPVRIAGDVSRSIALEAEGDHWVSVASALCTFMPLRGGIGDDQRTLLALDPDATVQVQTNQDQSIHPEQVRGILTEPVKTVWSGVTFGKAQPLDTLWLWLATHLPNRLSRMPVQRTAIDTGLVTPGLPWGDMAAVPVGERGLAYLTMRPDPHKEGHHELGIIAHGPAAQPLAEDMAEQAREWAPHRHDELAFTLSYTRGSGACTPTLTRRVLHRQHSTLVVTWEPAP